MVETPPQSSSPHTSHAVDRETESEVVEVAPCSSPSLRQLVRNTLSTTRRSLSDSRRRKISSNLSQAISERAIFHSHPFPNYSSSANTRITSSLATAASALDNLPRGSDVALKPVPRLPPNGRAWTRVQNNMSLPETYAHSFHVPYLGESDRQLRSSNSLARDLLQNDLSEEEDNSDVEDNVDCSFLRDDREDDRDDYMEAEYEDGASGRRSAGRDRRSRRMRRRRNKHVEAIWDRAAKRVALMKVMKQVGSVDNEPLSEAFIDVVCDVFGFWNRKLVTSYRRVISNRLSAMEKVDEDVRDKRKGFEMVLRQAEGEQVDSAAEIMKSESVKVFMCRQCYGFLCTLHGQFDQARPSSQPLDASTKDVDEVLASKIETDCEDRARTQCWYLKAETRDTETWCRELIAQPEIWHGLKPVIRELFETFAHDACRISAILRIAFPAEDESMRLSCGRVGCLMDQLFPKSDSGACNRKRIAVQQKKRKGKWKTQRVPQEQDSEMPGRRLDYEPCHHEGVCTMQNCSCKQRGILCEKFCGCFSPFIQDGKAQSFCTNMHRGCTCKGSCQSKACVCFSMNRECDPDLCRSCHECKEGSQDSKNWSCRNNGLRMRRRQKVLAGHSEVHGWGVFARGRIAKNEIIGEYVGEVISDDEAERRGRVYDEVTYSFLFTTTEQYALDSTHIGNKLRYCNHSLNPNCEPRVMRVDGDVRVGLYAKRDIEKHEELFFNYGYNENGPAWAMDGKTSKSKSTAGPSGKRKLESDNDSSDVFVEALPSSEKCHGVADVETGSPVEPEIVPKFVTSPSETANVDSANIEVAFPKSNTPSPGRKRRRKERIMLRRRESSRHQNRGIEETASTNPSALARGQSKSEAKPVGSSRSVWRDVLRRVSVGAADLESANRPSKLTNGHEDRSTALPKTENEFRTAQDRDQRASSDRKSGPPGEEPGHGSRLIEPKTDGGFLEFKEASMNTSQENGTLYAFDSGIEDTPPQPVDRSTVNGVHELPLGENEPNGIHNSEDHRGQDLTVCNEKTERVSTPDETDSDPEEPHSASWHAETTHTEKKLVPRGGSKSGKAKKPVGAEISSPYEQKQIARHGDRENSSKLSELSCQMPPDAVQSRQLDAHATAGDCSPMNRWKVKNDISLHSGNGNENLEKPSAKESPENLSNIGEGNGRMRSHREERLQATQVVCLDDEEAVIHSKRRDGRDCGLLNGSPSSGSGNKFAGETPLSKSQHNSSGKQVKPNSSSVEAAEVVDLVSVDGDESMHTTYEPNIRDWL